MKLAVLDFFQRRVGRRVVGLFVLASLVPLVALSALNYALVSGYLQGQAEADLRQVTDDASQSIMERLFILTVRLQNTSAATTNTTDGVIGATSADPLPPGVEGLAYELDGDVRTVAGSMQEVPALEAADRVHLAGGEAVLKTVTTDGEVAPTVFLAVRAAQGAPDGSVLWARITPDSLWSSGLVWALAADVDDFCVLHANGQPFYCLSGEDSPLISAVPLLEAGDGVGGLFEQAGESGEGLAAWRDVFMKASFNADPWTVAVSKPLATIYEPISELLYNVFIIMSAGLVLVLLLSNVVVRQTLEPLAKLTEGTRRIAAQDLKTRVDFESEDEFGELSGSFNTMAERLSSQFQQLEAGRAIDQAVLSTSDRSLAVRALLEGIREVVGGGLTAVFLLGSGSDRDSTLYYDAPGEGLVTRGTDEATDTGRTWLEGGSPRLQIADAHDVPAFLGPAGFAKARSQVLTLQLVVQGVPLGVVAVACPDGVHISDEAVGRAEQLVDQAAIALNDHRLRSELEEMSWEALRALAKAIDAKSKWTAGHSERVTELSLALGRHLGLTDSDLDIVHRGGLLHDLGKIGVSAQVLDFDGPLDAEMRKEIEAHPVIGAEILGPIRAFQPMLPIVLHHHERWDGKGYPDGIAGLDIPRLARLVAVADSFDAMASARPYRGALPTQVVLDHIQEGSGTAFDPEMVTALMELAEDGSLPEGAEAGVAIHG